MTQFPGAAQRLSADPVVPDSAGSFRPLMRDLVDTFNSTLCTSMPDTVVEYLAGLADGGAELLLSMLAGEGPAAEILDAIILQRQLQRLGEEAPGTDVVSRLRSASASARRSESHWYADCFAEAAAVVESIRDDRRALWSLAHSWATQSTDYDEDTEQQIEDGWTLLEFLEAPSAPTRTPEELMERGRAAMTQWRENGRIDDDE